MRHRFRHGVGKSTRADIVDEQDGVGLAQRPAAVDRFLCASLDFRVAALHGGEIEVGTRGAAAHRRGRAAAEADQHRGSAQHDELGADGYLGLLDMRAADVAEPAGDHDRLVIAARPARRVGRNGELEGTEVAADSGTAKLVVERGGADRPLQHDVERGSDARRNRGRPLPGSLKAGNAQVRNREAGETGFRPGTAACRALVTDLAAGAGRRPGEGRDGGRMIVGLDLQQDVDGLTTLAVGAGSRLGEVANPVVPSMTAALSR